MSDSSTTQKLLAIVGPTGSGKTDLAVRLAKKLSGEVLSVDSRQIYRGLDIGTGKIVCHRNQNGQLEHQDVVHYGIDIASPKKTYSVVQFQRYARACLRNIYSAHHLPIVCGGTAFWVDSVVYEHSFPTAKPNLKLRKGLERLSVDQLVETLTHLDADRVRSVDTKNPVRLIRAIEVATSENPELPARNFISPYDSLWVGLRPDKLVLDRHIEQRLSDWFSAGLVREVENLKTAGLSWKKIESFGLEYTWVARFLQHKISENDMYEQSLRSIVQYAKRQYTWLKRNPHIHWFSESQSAEEFVLRHYKE